MWFLDALKKIRKSDSWQNVVTQLGTSYDKQVYHRVYPEVWYDCEELEDLIIADAYARRIVCEPVDAAFRQGWDLTYGGNIDGEPLEVMKDAITDLLWDLDAEAKVKMALQWGRLYGRGALLLGANDGGQLTDPLDMERIQQDGLVYLDVLTCQEFSVVETYSDPEERQYGEPMIWRVTRTGQGEVSSYEIHESRLILTHGLPTSRQRRIDNEWRDQSVLQALYGKISNYDSANRGAAHMLLDASQAVLAIKGFSDLLSEETVSAFSARMRIMELARSLRIMPLDADAEKFEYIERTFAGVAELIDRAAQDLAGAAGMPQTILMGMSPAGLNATGESDIRGWYDQIQAEQTTTYQRVMEQVIYLAAISTGADSPDLWGIDWHSLWQETAKERDDRRKVIADTDQIYVNMGAVTEDEVAQTRFGGEDFNDGPIQLDMEAREALREQDLERAANGPPEPPLSQFMQPNEDNPEDPPNDDTDPDENAEEE